VDERVVWLDAGADRCLCHPLDGRELAARLRALIRALRPPSMQRLALGDLVLDPLLRSAALAGVPLALSDREFDLLERLTRQGGQPLSRAALEQVLYAGERPVASNAVEVHVHHLRRKLGAGWLRTVRGEGYALRPPAESD
jgi:DNA-binding response OmpR family regulator